MSEQIKNSKIFLEKNIEIKINKVLDLEKYYFDILWKIFTSQEFIEDLKYIESEIIKQYNDLKKKWNLKNKLKIPAERLTRQYLYKNLSSIIKKIYPSPISSDIAFITKDACINIDIKTLDKFSNENDIKNLQFENNQSSFNN